MFRKVDQERRVGRVRADEEAAVRLTVGRGEQSEVGVEDAVWRRKRKESKLSKNSNERNTEN